MSEEERKFTEPEAVSENWLVPGEPSALTEEQVIFKYIHESTERFWQPEVRNTDPRSAELGQEDIERARRMIEEAFTGKIRLATGNPYTDHLNETQYLLAQSGYNDPVLMIAALFHDGPEDVSEVLGIDVIKQEFGEDVARLVEGVTKEKTPGQSWQQGWDAFGDKLRSAKDERVILLELADRNSNLRDVLHNAYTPDAGDGKMVGENIWKIYKTSSPRDQLGMYIKMLNIFNEWAAGRSNALLADYAANVDALEDLINQQENLKEAA